MVILPVSKSVPVPSLCVCHEMPTPRHGPHSCTSRVQDPFDKTRIEALNEVKTEGKAWIAAHAKGGSAPGQAAKRMYVAVDAVQGHASANGAAPLPKQKVKFVSNVLDEVDVLISQGK